MFVAALTLTFTPADGEPRILGAGGDLDNDGFDDFVVAAPAWGPTGATPNAGLVRVYLGDPTTILAGAVINGPPASQFGRAAVIVPDTNGDGFDELLVGAPLHSPQSTVHLWRGAAANGLVSVETLNLAATDTNRAGAWLAAGDVNGDGLGDLAIGSPTDGSMQEGLVSIYSGAGGLLPQFLRDESGQGPLASLGTGLAMGDFDGDGFDDVVMGSPSLLSTTNGLYVLAGTSGGLVPTAVHLPGLNPEHIVTGDVDGDGYDDAIVSTGSTLDVAYGSAAGLTAPVTFHVPADQQFSGAVTLNRPLGIVDYNGDGRDDVLYGIGDDNVVRVFPGQPTGPSFFFPLEGTGGFGFGVQGAGDVDGDGFEDVLVIADAANTVQLFSGFADADGDGDGSATDCDDLDPARDSLDRDGDGTTSCAGDCADLDPTLILGVLWYEDADRDGFGAGPSTLCVRPSPTAVTNADDCDDADPDAFPGQSWYADADGDGYGDPAESSDCQPAAPTDVLDATDCDDTDADAFPGVTWYTDADGDGYGLAGTASDCARSAPTDVQQDGDCDDTDADAFPGVTFYTDADGDGFGDDDASWDCARNAASDVTVGGDCDDDDPDSRPDVTWYPDLDGDGYGDGSQGSTCLRVDPTDVTDGTDCNDANAEINPELLYYPDGDRDGFGDAGHPGIPCEPNSPTDVRDNTDCDDQRAVVFPGAVDRPRNGVDEDCDGADGTFTEGNEGNSGSCSTVVGGTWLGVFALLPLLVRRRGA